MSFVVDKEGTPFVLDQVNARIEVLPAGQPPRLLPLPRDTFQDLALDGAGGYVLLDRLGSASVAFMNGAGSITHEVPLAGPGVPEGGAVTALVHREDGTWVEVAHESLVRIADERGEPDPLRPSVSGRFTADGQSRIRAAVVGPTTAVLHGTPIAPGPQEPALRIDFPLPIAELSALESDAAGRRYLGASLLRERAVPPFDILDSAEMVVVIAPDGRESSRISLAPSTGPEEQFRPIRMGADGRLYQLSCTERGGALYRWRIGS
jgi:hypothetical protein